METYLQEGGLPALFLLSFLAATLLPLGSEWLLALLIVNGHPLGPTIFTATMGNTLGACTTYFIGLWGATFIIERLLRISKNTKKRAESLFQKFGSWSLLFSWLPVIGDPLCLVAGILRFPFLRFCLLVVVGKLLRYSLVAHLAKAALTGP